MLKPTRVYEATSEIVIYTQACKSTDNRNYCTYKKHIKPTRTDVSTAADEKTEKKTGRRHCQLDGCADRYTGMLIRLQS